MFSDFNPTPKAKMPDGWKSPMRAPLYQVVVQPTWLAVSEQVHGPEPIFVGPAMLMEYADAFCAAIKEKIARGDERYWSNPSVVLVSTLPGLH